MVARWHIFKPKILIWVNFLGLPMKNAGIFNSHLVYLTAIWYILWLFGTFFPVLVCCTKKYLVTLLCSPNTA
jgi:hypothetical protein